MARLYASQMLHPFPEDAESLAFYADGQVDDVPVYLDGIQVATASTRDHGGVHSLLVKIPDGAVAAMATDDSVGFLTRNRIWAMAMSKESASRCA